MRHSTLIPDFSPASRDQPIHKSRSIKRQSLKRKMNQLTSIMNHDDFQKGILQVKKLTQPVKSSIDISDFWGNKEKYLQNTGYFNAYLNLQHAKERKNFCNRLSRQKISTPFCVNPKVSVPTAMNLKNHKSSFSLPKVRDCRIYMKKCSDLTDVLEKMIQKSFDYSRGNEL